MFLDLWWLSPAVCRLRAQMEVECPEISLTKGKVFQLLQRMQEEYQRLEEKFETSKHAIRKLTRRLCELAEDSTQQAGNEVGVIVWVW